MGWSPRTDWWLLDASEAHGPFATQEAAVAACQRKPTAYGYGPPPQIGRLS